MRYAMMSVKEKDKIWFPPTMRIYGWYDSVLWLLEHLRQIDESKLWPREPSNYIDPGIHTAPSQQATFVSPVEAVIEITTRCSACGRDGTIVLAHYRYGVPIVDLAKINRISAVTVERKINRVILYCASGQCRRWITNKRRPEMSYEEWGR